jgi:WD40 repeat protein
MALPGQVGGGFGVPFSPDGRLLATASQDGTAKIWDAETGQELLTLFGPPHGLHDVAFSPDNRYLAAAGMDGTVRFYILPVNELIALAESRLTRSLTDEECQQFLHVEECPTR